MLSPQSTDTPLILFSNKKKNDSTKIHSLDDKNMTYNSHKNINLVWLDYLSYTDFSTIQISHYLSEKSITNFTLRWASFVRERSHIT